MLELPFKQVDVFTHARFKGNPVAVVLRAEDLSTEEMQQIANWTNLSETTFVVPPTHGQADYRVRIFTPNAELPFAGHPTIGTAHALVEAGMVQLQAGVLMQQCGAGLIRLEVMTDDEGRQWIGFDLPEPEITSVVDARQRALESVLGTTVMSGTQPLLVDVGPRWLVAQLPDVQTVLALEPDLQHMQQQDRASGDTGVVVFGEYAAGARSRIEVRAFAPALGVNEDPVCGSGNGCVAAYLRYTGQLVTIGQDYLASQGQKMGRDGLLRLKIAGERIQVAGNAITSIDGKLTS